MAMTLDSRTQERLAEISAAHGLDTAARDRLGALLLAVAADDHAPTTVRAPADAVDVHVADSLAALEVPAMRQAGRVADLGSGVGFPGLALAAALPRAEVALVESSGRTCAYLERLAGRLNAPGVTVVRSRAEAWEAGSGWADVVTARALAALPVLAEYAAPLLSVGGVLVAWKGTVEDGEATAGERAAAMLGLAPDQARAVMPYAGSRNRSLHVFRKVGPTPPGYPRRPGMARKRPLGV